MKKLSRAWTNDKIIKKTKTYVVAKLLRLFLILSYKQILAAHGMESLHVQKFVQQSMGGVVVALQDFILFYWQEEEEK